MFVFQLFEFVPGVLSLKHRDKLQREPAHPPRVLLNKNFKRWLPKLQDSLNSALLCVFSLTIHLSQHAAPEKKSLVLQVKMLVCFL
jgi:hypothetical protein